MSLSKQLIHLRSINGMSQEELASLLNVTRQSVSKWESEQSIPDGEKIIRISEIFHVTTDYLLKGIETDPIDIYATHHSKAGAQMSAEVNEILDNVHYMSRTKRLGIGLAILCVIIIVIFIVIELM